MKEGCGHEQQQKKTTRPMALRGFNKETRPTTKRKGWFSLSVCWFLMILLLLQIQRFFGRAAETRRYLKEEGRHSFPFLFAHLKLGQIMLC